MSLLNQAKAAGKVVDQTEATAGYEYSAPPEGWTTARFMGYVEIGKQPQRPYQGKEKPPALEAILTFELNSPKHVNEYEVDGEKRTRTNVVTEKIKVSSNEKSNFYKLLSKMAAGRQDIKHMAEMLGEGFLVKITHNVVEKDGKKRTYCNLKDENGYNVGAPEQFDAVNDKTTKINVPAATVAPQLLLWAAPTQEQWDSIFIDGTYTKKEGDQEVEVSKNFTQQLCQKATDFVGSPVEAFLSGGDDIAADLANVPDDKPETIETASDESEINPPPVDAEPDGPTSDDDVLGDLGLV